MSRKTPKLMILSRITEKNPSPPTPGKTRRQVSKTVPFIKEGNEKKQKVTKTALLMKTALT